ncbi:MAG: sulfotransferase [Planctomycetota bacterium]
MAADGHATRPADPAVPELDELARSIFFIVGTGRCGTTLLQSMLMSHPRLTVPQETRFFLAYDPIESFGDPIPAPRRREYVDSCVGQWRFADLGLTAGAFAELVERAEGQTSEIFLGVMAQLLRQSGTVRIGEKTPAHLKHVDRIAELLPHARFIHVIRDPRDVALSMESLSWAAGPARWLRYGRSWSRAMQRDARYHEQLGPSRWMRLRMEDLVLAPAQELERTCSFLGEDYDPVMLQYHDRQDPGFMDREAGWKALTQRPLDTSRIGRYRQKLSHHQIRSIERNAQPWLERLGYGPEPFADRMTWRFRDALETASWRTWRVGQSVRKRLRPVDEPHV